MEMLLESRLELLIELFFCQFIFNYLPEFLILVECSNDWDSCDSRRLETLNFSLELTVDVLVVVPQIPLSFLSNLTLVQVVWNQEQEARNRCAYVNDSENDFNYRLE